MNKNILYSSGQIVEVAIGENYTLKEDEVYINQVLYKKKELEVALNNNDKNNNQNSVGVAIRTIGNKNNRPADFTDYKKWLIDDIQPISLSDCLLKISDSIFFASVGGGSVYIAYETYEDFYTSLQNQELIAGATYKFPYKSVNFLNGRNFINRVLNNNIIPSFPSLTGMEVNIGEEEIFVAKAINNSEIEPYVFSEKYPNDIIEFNPLVTKLGVNLQITNGTVLPDASVATDFNIKWDSLNSVAYLNMPTGYPALAGHYFYLYAEFEKTIQVANSGGLISSFSILSNTATIQTNGFASKTVGYVGSHISGYQEVISGGVTLDGSPLDFDILATISEDISENKFVTFSPVSVLDIDNNAHLLSGNSFQIGQQLNITFDVSVYGIPLGSPEIDTVNCTKKVTIYNTNGTGVNAEFLLKQVSGVVSVYCLSAGMFFNVNDTVTVPVDNNSVVLNITGATPISYAPQLSQYYQDGCYEPIGITPTKCQYPYTSDDPDFGYPSKMSRAMIVEGGAKVLLLDLTEDNVNDYLEDTLSTESVRGLVDAYGWINRRQDLQKKIDVPLDFRGHKIRRYLATGLENYQGSAGSGVSSAYISLGGNEITLLQLGFGVAIQDDYKDFNIFSDGEDVERVFIGGIGGSNEFAWYTGTSYNFLFKKNVGFVYIDSIYDCTIEGGFRNNRFKEIRSFTTTAGFQIADVECVTRLQGFCGGNNYLSFCAIETDNLILTSSTTLLSSYTRIIRSNTSTLREVYLDDASGNYNATTLTY